MTIQQYLQQTTNKLDEAGIATARLDAQVLLCNSLKKDKAWILAHGDDEISPEIFSALLDSAERRSKREPIAYILQRKEFYGRDFFINPDVLIPRPETETLIDEIKSLNLREHPKILDVGTGSGAIAISLDLEMPQSQIEACDINNAALEVAEKNAEKLKAQIHFFESNLLNEAESDYDCIVANLPYVSEDWQHSPETSFEPKSAIFADDNGLLLIKVLILQAPKHLKPNGFLVLEADPRQFETIKKNAEPFFYTIKENGFCIIFKKI